MTQLANKTFKCEQLVLENFEAIRVPLETRGAWLELAGAVCENSACLEELTVSNTVTTAEQGKDFLYQFSDAWHLDTLKRINFSGGRQFDMNTMQPVDEPLKWFSEEQEAFGLLLAGLSRQTNLEKLTMRLSGLNDD